MRRTAPAGPPSAGPPGRSVRCRTGKVPTCSSDRTLCSLLGRGGSCCQKDIFPDSGIFCPRREHQVRSPCRCRTAHKNSHLDKSQAESRRTGRSGIQCSFLMARVSSSLLGWGVGSLLKLFQVSEWRVVGGKRELLSHWKW